MKLDLTRYKGLGVCVALSGGMDSVCLLHYLHCHAAEYGIVLSALTCEHGIRGENSLRDLAFVRQLCTRWQIPLYEFAQNVPARANESGTGLEEEGRSFRYDCFARVVRDGKADAVATAHHQGDVAETVLFRLIRGTSLGGLGAIEEREGIIRPLLSVSKAEIEAYAKEYGLSYVTDETNTDERYTRNLLRRSILPRLEDAVCGAGEHLIAFAARAKRDDEFLEELARKQMTVREGEVYIPAELQFPLFSRACVLALKHLGVVRDYTQDNIAEAERLQALQSGKKICLPHGIEAAREGRYIVFYRPQTPFAGEIAFATGHFALGNMRVNVSDIECGGALYADYESFPADCVIRTRREGDQFTPYGGGTKSLKKFLTDRKIPARRSKCLPVVAKGKEVFAVFDVEISEQVKVTRKTQKTVWLSAQAIE